MLAVISDLHLQHLGQDSLRHLLDGEVYLTRVARNVGEAALELWFAEIQSRLERRRVDALELVLAGDIFEIHRSPLWLTSSGEPVRPTREDLGDDTRDNPLRQRVHEILDAVVAENAGFFAALERFVREGRYVRHAAEHTLRSNLPVSVHYILGNHDRLLGAWPSVRRRVRELLAMDGEGAALEAPFPRYLEWAQATGYGVRLRHGHEYDPWNFSVSPDGGASLDAEPAAYLRPNIGDYITVDFATRIATSFRVRYAEELRTAWPHGPRLRELYTGLLEFDDVRPARLLMRYLSQRLGASDAETFERLRPVLLEVLTAAQRDPFFRREARRIGAGAYFDGLRGQLVRFALAKLPARWLGAIIDRLASRGADVGEGPASVAALEPRVTALGIDTVVAGHTHQPDEVPLGGERFFLDTGTWRTRIKGGVGEHFGRLRALTMVFCYGAGERQGNETGRRFETWTGYLVANDLGPTTEKVGPRGEAREQLRIERVHVRHVDEGRTPGGAELHLRIGVDGERRDLRLDDARDDTVATTDVTIPIWRALDGELWVTGVERDRGPSFWDPDDPLPWACQFLARAPTAGEPRAYATGQRGRIVMRDRTAHIDLDYVVESLASDVGRRA